MIDQNVPLFFFRATSPPRQQLVLTTAFLALRAMTGPRGRLTVGQASLKALLKHTHTQVYLLRNSLNNVLPYLERDSARRSKRVAPIDVVGGSREFHFLFETIHQWPSLAYVGWISTLNVGLICSEVYTPFIFLPRVVRFSSRRCWTTATPPKRVTRPRRASSASRHRNAVWLRWSIIGGLSTYQRLDTLVTVFALTL